MKDIPPMVRILPMDRTHEFNDSTIDKVQEEFFLEDLPYRKDERGKGGFLYKTRGMKAERGTIVLFQYDGKIIALAELTDIKKFEKPQFKGGEEYKGAYYFDPYSIRTFKPISKEEMNRIWGNEFIGRDGKKHPAFERFNQTKQFLNPEKYPDFYSLLENIEEP